MLTQRETLPFEQLAKLSNANETVLLVGFPFAVLATLLVLVYAARLLQSYREQQTIALELRGEAG